MEVPVNGKEGSPKSRPEASRGVSAEMTAGGFHAATGTRVAQRTPALRQSMAMAAGTM